MIVVSTAFDPPPEAKARCLASVAEQRPYAPHFYIDAAEQDPPLSHFENLLRIVSREPLSHFENLLRIVSREPPAMYGGLPDDEIIVSLDGDDWLAGPGALARVQAEHDAGALVTYGSFRYADGRPGFAARPSGAGPLRSSPWTTTHLKTFRAGLLRRIKHEHFRAPAPLSETWCSICESKPCLSTDRHGKGPLLGPWLEHARDLALMFPLLEMAGDRAHYIADVLMIYNYANSTEFRGGAEVLAAERAAVAYVRSLPPYTELP